MHRPMHPITRCLVRDVRLPGLTYAATIHNACAALVEAGWLLLPPESGAPGRPRAIYIVRPELWETLA